MITGKFIAAGNTKSPLVPSTGKTGAPGSVGPHLTAIGAAPVLMKDV